jgi:hypothetical protein
MPQPQGGKTQQQGRRNRRDTMMELYGEGISSVQSATSAGKVEENSIHTDSIQPARGRRRAGEEKRLRVKWYRWLIQDG